MRKKYIYQVFQDVLMLLVLLSLMGYHLWGEYAHEIFGVVFLGFILLHSGLNLHWFHQLFQGEYPVFRILQVVINLILAVVFVTAILSGLMLSQHLLPNLLIHDGSDFVRKIHMASVHWGQVVIAIHLGMHWKMLSNFFFRIWSISPKSKFVTRYMPMFFLLISIYGVHELFQRKLLYYLFFQVDFSFFNFDESRFVFYTDHLSIIIFIAYLIRYLLWLFLFREKHIHTK